MVGPFVRLGRGLRRAFGSSPGGWAESAPRRRGRFARLMVGEVEMVWRGVLGSGAGEQCRAAAGAVVGDAGLLGRGGE